MKHISTLITRILPILSICLVILVAGNAIYWFGLEQPYREFDAKEQAAIPLFDALNEKILNELPPLPSGTENVHQYSEGLVYPHQYLHGRRLNIEAETSMSQKDVETYYKSFLQRNGWEVIRESMPLIGGPGGVKEGEMPSFITFRRGTSCVEISNPPSFGIVIWHDFSHQTFSPPLPNLTYLWLQEYGMSLYISCP